MRHLRLSTQPLTPKQIRVEIAKALGLSVGPRDGADLRAVVAALLDGRDPASVESVESTPIVVGTPVDIDAEIARLQALGYRPSVAARPALSVEPLRSHQATGRTTLALLAWMLFEPPSLPGDTIHLTKGRRVARVSASAERRPERKRAPSRRLASLLLRALYDAFECHRRRTRPPRELHAATLTALFLMHEHLDTSRVFVTSRTAPAPTRGSERVRWIARKVRDLTRDPRI